MKAAKKKTTIQEALSALLQSMCIPALEGGGKIGGSNPKAIECDIRIHLHKDGSGYIHVMNTDSDTKNFDTIDQPDFKQALGHIKNLIDEYGTCSDSLRNAYKRDALKFLESINKH